MRKIILLDDYFPTGEATMQPALLWHAGKPFRDAFGGVTKTASEAMDYIKNVNPKEGKTIILIIGLGAEETYGPNRNGDGFSEHPVKAKNGPGYWVEPGQELTKHYQSFEKGHAFLHHQNKDPKKAVGSIMKAFWNPKMHRVELLIELDNNKAQQVVQRINDGEKIAGSMGCRIKFDVCSSHGHKAPSRADYCDEIKYKLGQLNDDGTRNYVYNPDPDFFDYSMVAKPADKTAFMLKKVAMDSIPEIFSAQLGEMVDDLDFKRAALSKISDIEKIIRGEPAAFASHVSPEQGKLVEKYRDYKKPTNTAPNEFPVGDLLGHKPADVLATLAKMGIVLTTKEFLRYIIPVLAGKGKAAESDIDNIISIQGAILEQFAEHPELFDSVMNTGILSDGEPRPEIEEKVNARKEKMGSVGSYLGRQVTPEGGFFRDFERPTTDMLSFTDPRTGQIMRTNRGAARDAHDMEARGTMGRMLGGAALLGGAYSAARFMPGVSKWIKYPLAAGLGIAGVKNLKPRFSHPMQTNEGPAISPYTEVVPGERVAHVRIAEAADAFMQDYAPNPGEAPGLYPETTGRRTLRRIGGFVQEHPLASMVAALGSYGLLKNKFASLIKEALEQSESDYGLVVGPQLNFNAVAAKLSELLSV